MNKLVRSLLSGASLATLQLCAVTAARAAGTTISGAHGAITNPAGNTQDYILVTGATITGDLTNEGTVGPGTYYGIQVNSSTISGAIINAATGVIAGGSEVGILIETSGAVAGGIQNAGKILVANTTNTHGTVEANAISFNASSVASITNTGTIGVNVQVIGASTGNAHAFAGGAEEYVNAGNAGNIVETFTGTGGAVNLTAGAQAHTSADARAYAYAESGIKQNGQNSANIKQTITNSGALTLSAKAKATSTTGGYAEASARAEEGLKQHASNNATHIAGATFTQSITNSGSISLAATVTANGHGYASGSAAAEQAIKQLAHNAQTISQSIDNSGDLSLIAKVKAVSVTSDADDVSAFAGDAISQDAYNQASHAAGAKITQSITNTGSVTLSAVATASAHDYASASARAEGAIEQYADSAQTISQTINNSGDISLVAKLKAVSAASEVESATASAQKAFAQAAYNNFSHAAGVAVTQSITNTGSVTLSAVATASAHEYASGSATAENVVKQHVENAQTISQTVNNSGDVSLVAKIKVVSATSDADDASAFAGDVFSQVAYNNDFLTGATITQSITNSGSITVAATAVGRAARYASVQATAEYAFDQYATNALTISQTLANTGDISMSANAKATSTASEVEDLNAFAGRVASQDAYINSSPVAGASITQSITNSGSVTLAATAAAKALDFASASATAEYGFKQGAYYVPAISQTISNTGAISFTANAKATGTSSGAQATAYAGNVFQQYAQSDGTTGSTATQGITNTGAMTLAAMATANASENATAEARVEDVFYQQEYFAGAVTQTISNTGALSVAGAAKAVAQTSDARVRVIADAVQLFSQNAQEAGTANQTITNSGALNITLKATGTNAAGVSADVEVTANASELLRQYAKGTGTTSSGGVKATQKVTNSGSITIAATAAAKGGLDASAYATASSLIYQDAEHFATISETATNSGTIHIALKANASGGSSDTEAEVEAEDLIEQFSDQDSNAGEVASLTAVNSGAISVAGTAVATGTRYVSASAEFREAIYQEAEDSGTATLSVTNSGAISVLMSAKASGGTSASATAEAEGIYQQGEDNVVSDVLSATNSASIVLQAKAVAAATGNASAEAYGTGIEQRVYGETHVTATTTPAATAALSVSNSGTISLLASAQATGGLSLSAEAYAYGIDQYVSGAASTVSVNNSGTVSVAAVATAHPGTVGAGVTATATRLPYVDAYAAGITVNAHGKTGPVAFTGISGIYQSAAPLTLDISNSGTVDISATANGTALAAANIFANAAGIAVAASSVTNLSANRSVIFSAQHFSAQKMYGAGKVSGTIDNSGTIDVSASADGGIATASGITVTADDISATVSNAHGALISVEASGATAVAVGIAESGIKGFEARRELYGYTAPSSHAFHNAEYTTYIDEHGPATSVTGAITNSGTIVVSATSTGANIGDGTDLGDADIVGAIVPGARARAEGIAINAQTMAANILNAGTIDVSATGANAVANGIHLFAQIDGAKFTRTYDYSYHTSVAGYVTVRHSSTSVLHTVLTNNVVTGNVSNTGTVSVSATGSGAAAKGVYVQAGTWDSAFVNSGKIFVSASGTGASAVGVQIDASSLGSGASFQNNGGTISATLNGGWGSAIDVSGAPATLALGLNGGSIFGNVVENAAGNAISVGSGNLVLNGLINPSRAKLGSLTVGAGGTLSLANNAVLGDASAYVNSFKQTGTLAITGGTDGSSGSIHAVNASLTGAAIVNLDLGGGIYGTSTTYKVVFSDNALDGTWSSVKPASATTFFSASGVYTTNEADITLTRATFDSIAGLTDNEVAVAGAIETIYDGSGTSGPLGRLLDALFNLTPQQYADALEALSGMPAGELTAVDQATAQSFLDAINNHLAGTSGGDDGDVASLTSTSQMLAANIAPTAVTPAQMTSLSGTHVWGGGFQSGNSVNRTASGPAYDSHNNGLLAGVDVPVSPDLLFGVAGSWSTGDIQTEKMEGFGTFTALQVAGYARYVADNGLYAQGDVSYGDFTNKLNRYVAIPGFGAGNVHGTFDSKAWGLYGETGWKFNPSGWATSLTPYAAVSYLDAKSDGYTETGSFGAPLTVGGSSSKATSSYLGLKLSTDWQVSTATITPRITAAWQHDFTKNAWEMSAAFAAVPTAGFGLNGSDLSRDGAFLDGGVTLHIAEQVDVLLDYQGRFTSDRTDNAFMARANIRF